MNPAATDETAETAVELETTGTIPESSVNMVLDLNPEAIRPPVGNILESETTGAIENNVPVFVGDTTVEEKVYGVENIEVEGIESMRTTSVVENILQYEATTDVEEKVINTEADDAKQEEQVIEEVLPSIDNEVEQVQEHSTTSVAEKINNPETVTAGDHVENEEPNSKDSSLEETMHSLSIREKQADHFLHEDPKMKVIAEYLRLATHSKSSQASLMQDPVPLGYLINFATEESSVIVTSALQVFKVLVANRGNIPTLLKNKNFVCSLKSISKNSSFSHDIRNDAYAMLQKLHNTRAPLGEQSNTTRNVGNTSLTQQSVKRQMKSEVVQGTKKQNSGIETVLLLSPAVVNQPCERHRVTSTLIKVTGILSVTFNRAKSTCIIRGKRHVPPENFASAVAKLGYEVSWVHKNEKKEEIVTPFEVDKNDGSTLQENFPEYLPEEDEVVPVDDNALTTNAALAGKKQTDTERGWFSSAKSFVSSSFYW